jgi:hypothetical protein
MTISVTKREVRRMLAARSPRRFIAAVRRLWLLDDEDPRVRAARARFLANVAALWRDGKSLGGVTAEQLAPQMIALAREIIARKRKER